MHEVKFSLESLNLLLLVGWRVWRASNLTTQDIPEVFCWGHVWWAYRPRQHAHVVGSKEVSYDSGCMGSGIVMLINDATWLLLEKWYDSQTQNVDSQTQNVVDIMLSCQVSINDDHWALRTPGRKEGNVLFNDALNTFYFMVMWHRTYDKGPLI